MKKYNCFFSLRPVVRLGIKTNAVYQDNIPGENSKNKQQIVGWSAANSKIIYIKTTTIGFATNNTKELKSFATEVNEWKQHCTDDSARRCWR